MTFTHLIEINKSYFGHFQDAFSLGLQTLKISGIFFVHAFYPDVFTDTGSEEVKKLLERCKILRGD